MSTRLRVPEKRAANPKSGREFPVGEWLWEIEEIRTREIDPGANSKLAWMFEPNAKGNQRYTGKTAETVSLQLGKAQALAEGQEAPGEQKLFVEITLRDGDVYVDEIGDKAQEKQGVGYQIAIDGALYVNLALALGCAFTQDGYASPSDDFRERLIAGEFKGFKVAGTVVDDSYTKRDGKTRVERTALEHFSPAA